MSKMPKANSPEVPLVEEELVQDNDQAIGRALRWSVAALVLIGIAAGVISYISKHPAAKPSQANAKITAPVTPTRLSNDLPTAKFTDITKEAGITFVHTNGAFGDKLLPETMGAGVAFFDFDNDGKQDVLFVNATAWPDHPQKDKPPATLHLYHNDGAGHFTDVTAGSGLDVSMYGMGVAVGDYDNDGLVDVFVTGVGGYHLFHNEGHGKFKDVTAEAGVGGSAEDWGTSCAFVDYDNDGKLDLFVCNYVRWSKEIDRTVGYSLVGIGRAYGPPTNFQGAFCRLYHNEGNGHFKDVSEQAGIRVRNHATNVQAGKSLAVAAVDVDGDGWLDLVVANDTVPNFYFRNQRDGTFKEIGSQAGVAFDSYGNTRGAMGIDSAHYRNDNSLGIGVGNFANEMMALYVAQSSGAGAVNHTPLFTDDAITEGVGPPSRLLLKFGLFFFDYDLDGFEDLLTANGHLEEDIHKVQLSQNYTQPAQLFWNHGASGGGFLPVTPDKCGSDLFQPIVGRGSAFADIDGDGDLDVMLTQVAGPPLLLRNDQKLGHHWLRLKLIGNGTTTNRDAIGAQIKVRLGSRVLWRQVMPTRGYLSQSELPVTIGLGELKRPDSIEITWPGGPKQTITDFKVDEPTEVRQK
jgi:hypothetical protein